MKTYKSHKEVKAAKIVEVTVTGGNVELDFGEGFDMLNVAANHSLFARHESTLASLVGMYLVQYEDGYLSLSPAKAFEEGYHLAPTPRMDANAIEAEIQAKGLTAPRITPAMIDEAVRNVEYHVFGGTTLTVACVTLWNGFTVTGESACASPANFDKELGEKIALQNAKQKIWALEGYRLRSFLHGTVNGTHIASAGPGVTHKESVAEAAAQ